MGGYSVVPWLLVGLCCWIKAGTCRDEIVNDVGVCSKVPPMRVGQNSGTSTLRKRFVLQTEILNWYNAMAYCRRRGMDLASIHTKEEQDVVAALISNITGPDEYEFWVSGSDLALDEYYVWVSSGSPMSYTNWADNEPAKKRDCVEVQWDKLWRTYDCPYEMYFISGPSKYEFWISVTDQGTDEHFVWLSSGTPMTYTNWAPQELVTEKDFVEVRWDRLWRTYYCSYKMFAICEYYYW